MKAMIMAAGKGTRLGKITDTIPKVLVDINGQSVLERAVKKCSRYGFDDIVINVHHFAERVILEADRLKNEGFKITISDESGSLRETGGGLFRARKFFDDSPFLLYNADIITDLDLSVLYNYHKEKQGLATLAVRNRKGNRFFLVDNAGRLSGWCNKATGETIISRKDIKNPTEIAFSGIHIIDPEIFNFMTDGIYTMTSVYLKLASERNIFTFQSDGGYWYDIGTPENLEAARSKIF